MSTQVTIRGRSTILWGARGVVDANTYGGMIISVTDAMTGETVEVPDDIGYTVAVVLFNERHDCEVQFAVDSSFPLFARGDEVTIAGMTCICTDITKNWAQKDVTKCTVKATLWQGVADAEAEEAGGEQ